MDIAPTGIRRVGRGRLCSCMERISAARPEATIGVLTQAGYRVIVPDRSAFAHRGKTWMAMHSSARSTGMQYTQAPAGLTGIERATHPLDIPLGGKAAARQCAELPASSQKGLVMVNPLALKIAVEAFPTRSIDHLLSSNELKTSFDKALSAYQAASVL